MTHCSPIMVRLEFQGKYVVFRALGRCPRCVIRRSNRARFLFKSSHEGPPEDGRERGDSEGQVGVEKRAIREADMMGLFISKNRLGFAAVTSNPPKPQIPGAYEKNPKI